MKKNYLITGLLALVLIAVTGIRPALAYFTGTVSASGGQTVTFDFASEMEEKVKDLTKEVTLKNTGETEVFVRARAFVGEEYKLQYEGEDWTLDSDGWYVYGKTVAPGASAVFKVSVTDVPENVEDGETLNVAVVYECTPAQYKADGTAYPDWDYAYRDVTKPEGGNG